TVNRYTSIDPAERRGTFASEDESFSTFNRRYAPLRRLVRGTWVAPCSVEVRILGQHTDESRSRTRCPLQSWARAAFIGACVFVTVRGAAAASDQIYFSAVDNV